MKFLQIIFLFFLLITSCTQQQFPEIKLELDQLIDQQIQDKRVAYCNINISVEEDQFLISGATVSKAAFDTLKTFAAEKDCDFAVDLLPDDTFKEKPWAIVTLSVCNIRSNARHFAEMLTQATMGTPVKVFREEDGWFLVQTPDRYFGWVDAAGIALKSNEEMTDWKSLKKVLYKEQYGFAYSAPVANSQTETDLVLDNLLSVVDETGDFYKITLADGYEAFVNKNECADLAIWYNKRITAKDVLVSAVKFTGVPYLWGGTSAKMVDCSGFVKSVYFHHGIILQRDASQQTLYGKLVDTENGYLGLEPGDLVFFGKKVAKDQNERVTHVGLYLGDQEFIHASGKVRINSLDCDSENYADHYEKGFIRARRVLKNLDGYGIERVVDNAFFKQVLPD